ncbi:putative ribonuclease H-like domain-containing protein [Tanacetum coccineum]
MVRNKARLVAQDYTQKEGIDYDEVFALVAMIEAIRLFLAYASFMNFTVYQMDVKSAFLYGTIEEKVYVCQPPGFEDLEFPNKVYKVEKDLYGLHQALRAWYETLSTYLLENRFRRGTIDKTLFIKKDKGDILLVQMKQQDDRIFISQDKYMADILKKFDFSTVKTTSTPIETNKALLKDEEAVDVDVHLYRLMIGSLMYLTTSRPDIMFVVCACARFQVTPKTLHLHDVKRIFRYLKGHPWYPRDSPFDLEAFSDSDYAGASLDRKSTTRGCQFLRRRLISWQYKKQTIVANYTTEAEYVAAANCCGQSSGPIPLVTYETVIKEWEDRMERAATTASSLEAEQDNGNINSTQSMSTLNESFPQGTNLEKPKESNGFEGIIDFLNVSSIKYALTVNPTIYESCIKQLWATAKAKTVNGECQIQALVDTKKVIITEKNVRSDHMLEDAEGTECLPNDVIFEQLTLMGYENLTQKLTFYKAYFSSQWKFLIHIILQCLSAKTTSWNEFSSTMKSAIICLATNQKFNFSMYIFDNMMKNLEGEVKFVMYPRFVQVFLDKQVEGMSKHKRIYVTPSHTKKIFANMKREGKGFSGRITSLFKTMMVQAPEDMEATNKEPISTPSCDPPQSGEDRLQLTELMILCTKLQKHVLDLEEAKTAQAKEIASLKKRVKQLEKKRKSRTSGLKRLRKIYSSNRVESSTDVSLGAQEDASKQGRKITYLDADAKVTLINEAQERNNEDLMFDTDVLNSDEVYEEPIVNAAKTTSSFLVSAVDELTLAQTLIEIKAAKPKAVTTTAITTTTTNPRLEGL